MATQNLVPPRKWVRRAEAARQRPVTQRWLEYATQHGLLPYHRVGNLVLIDLDDLDALIEAGRVEATQP